jgi:sensor histidine kinase regulating citrate/malate metabolism
VVRLKFNGENKMQANDIIRKYADKFFMGNSLNTGLVAVDNDEMIELLNDEAVYVQDIMAQETWTLSDGSYITRLHDEYWTGDDVAVFEVEAELHPEI